MEQDVFLRLIAGALPELQSAFAKLPSLSPVGDEAAMERVLATVAGRMADNYPYFHPLYAGQMLKPPHPVARAAYAMAMWLNPNNHALDGGKASSQMEVEAVRAIAAMFGWESFLGHLTSGGTFANLEALWIAGQLAPGKKIVASAQSHYTHKRISSVLQLPFDPIATDARGRMDMGALESALKAGDVGMVVVTLGTTAMGAVDPLDEILALRERYEFRIHVDAAYGGYFKLASNLGEEARRAFDRIAEADSIVVDPHKHGLQPYGCGCVLFRDPGVGRFYKHDSPYTYFTSSELHLGEISLECSRAGASAVALWATQQLLPLVPGGEFARGLEDGRKAAQELYSQISCEERFITGFAPELDILVWAVRADSVEESSRLAQVVFDKTAELDLHLALVQTPVSFFQSIDIEKNSPLRLWTYNGEGDRMVTCLRSVLMKPEHLQWVDEIAKRLFQALEETD